MTGADDETTDEPPGQVLEDIALVVAEQELDLVGVPAEFVDRFVAKFVDAVVLGFACLFLWCVGAWLVTPGMPSKQADEIHVLLLVLAWLCHALMQIGDLTRDGSIGKRQTGLAILTPGRAPSTLRQRVLRLAIRLFIPYLLLATLIIDGLRILRMSPGEEFYGPLVILILLQSTTNSVMLILTNRTTHDLITGTVVGNLRPVAHRHDRHAFEVVLISPKPDEPS